MPPILLVALLVQLARSRVIQVELDPTQPDASAQRFQNALHTATPELMIELSMASEGWIAVHDGPFRVNRSVAIVADPASPFPPSFDCLGRSSLLIANASHDASSSVSLSGIRVRNGRSEVGGSLQLLAGTVRLQGITISGSTATMGPGGDQHCSSEAPLDECVGGGGAVFVQATSVWMDGVYVHNVSTPLSGGAISIADTRQVHLRSIVVRDAHSGGGGGAIAISSSLRVPHEGLKWAISNVTAAGTRAGKDGGAVSLFAAGDVRSSSWSVAHVVATDTTAGGSGGAVSLLAEQNVWNSSWSVAHVTARGTEASINGGVVAFLADNEMSNSTWSVAHVSSLQSKAGVNGGAVCFVSAGDVSSSVWSSAHVATTGATVERDGGAVLFLAVREVSDSVWSVLHVDATRTVVGGAGGSTALVAVKAVRNSTWSVVHVTATSTVVSGDGGAVYLYTNGEASMTTWSVAHITAKITTAGKNGGAVSLFSARDVSSSTWSVRHVAATSTSSFYNGGTVSLIAGGVVLNSTWTVAQLTASNTFASGGGGVVSLVAASDVSNSAWWVTHLAAMNSTAGEGGGAVYFATDNAVSNSTWSVERVHATHTTAGSNGGAVAFIAASDVSLSSWSVEHVTATSTTAPHLSGGAVALWTQQDVSHSTWSVAHVAATRTGAGANGGAVSLLATNVESNSTWSVAHVNAAGTDAQRGGVLALRATTVTDSVCSITGLVMKACTATAQGGGVFISVQWAERNDISLVRWHAIGLTAQEGAVGVLLHADAASGAYDGLHVVARQFRVVGARAKQCSGVLAIHAGRPHQVPWRTHSPIFCARLSCALPYYNSSEVPLVYAVRVSASEWDVAGISATSGALATLDNVNASFANLQVRHVSVTARGGLWSLSGYTALSVHNTSATIRRASASAQGLLLDQSESPGNLSLSNVSARFEEGTLMDSGVQSWIHAGALTPAALSSMSIQCPMGATFHNASLGRIQLTESPFLKVEETYVVQVGLVARSISSAQAFPYSTASLGCRLCLEGTYMLARLAWVSSDVAGAVCTPGLDPNVTMPLCHSAPEHRSSCVECPTGAACRGGARVTAQFGYACSSSSCQQRFDSCAGDRAGFACGRCVSGFGEVIGSVGCVADAECRDWEHYTAWIAFPLGCIAAAALFLHSADSQSDGVSSGLTTILFVLFQSEAIIRTHDESKSSALSHWSMFQISLPAARVCLWPVMSARAKALVPLGTNVAILGVLGLIYGAHWLLHRRRRLAYAPSSQRYRRALVSLLLVSYGAIAGVCLKLVTRTKIDGAWYQSLTGERWMATADQWVALLWLVTSTVPTPLWFWYGLAHLRVGTMSDVTFGLGLLFPLPAAKWPWVMRRWPVTWDEKQAARDLRSTLAAPYGDGHWYWDGVFLAQRLVLGLISVSLASDLVYRACAMAVVVVAAALVYTQLHVFASSAVNTVHSVALAGLLVVCFSNGISAYTYQHGYEATPDLLAVHGFSTWSLWAVPVVAVAAKYVHVRQKAGSTHGRRSGWSLRWRPRLQLRRTDDSLSKPLMQLPELQGEATPADT